MFTLSGAVVFALAITGFIFHCLWDMREVFFRWLKAPDAEKAEARERVKIAERFEAARAVHRSRKALEEFFSRNEDENCSSPRGKEYLLHHKFRYEEYLMRMGFARDADKRFKDAYWAQLEDHALWGGTRRSLPSLPPFRGVHYILGNAKENPV